MMHQLHFALPFTAALGCGLMAGIFFAFSVFVMTALGRLPPGVGMAAMNAINAAILNPLFFTLFFGTAAVSLLSAIAAVVAWPVPSAFYLIGGGMLYLVGSLLVTVRFNVPLNQALAAAEAESADGARLWSRYLAVWTAWNHVRTATSLAATGCFILALD